MFAVGKLAGFRRSLTPISPKVNNHGIAECGIDRRAGAGFRQSRTPTPVVPVIPRSALRRKTSVPEERIAKCALRGDPELRFGILYGGKRLNELCLLGGFSLYLSTRKPDHAHT